MRHRWLLMAGIGGVMAALILSLPAVAPAAPLTLDRAIARALRLAPTAASAIAQSELNQARVAEARAPLYPSIFANGEYNQAPGYDPVITNRGLTLAQLALGWTAFDGGRRLAQLRAARYAAMAAVLGVAAVRNQIVFATTVAYFDLLRTLETEQELRASLARLAKYVRIIEALRRSGRATANDVLTVRATRDAAMLSLAAMDQAVTHASIVLGSMIGDFSGSVIQVAEVSGLPPPPHGDVYGNPDYRAAERQVESAQAGIRAARDERAPTLRLALTSGWEGIDPPKTFGRHLGASYDGTVTVPLFQGGLVRAHIDQAKAAEQLALAQQKRLALQLRRDLLDTYTGYRSALEQLAILRRSQRTADDGFALDWTRFLGGGTVTLLEVISAYQQAENLRLTRFGQEFNARQATAQARMLLGLP